MTKRRAPDVVNDFDAWASVSAELHGLSAAEAERLLADLTVAEVWETADAAWSKAMAIDIADMRLERIHAYAAVCARARVLAQATDDFRFRALYGQSDTARDASRRALQKGGTPFSSDPDDRHPTRRMHAEELPTRLARQVDGSADDASDDELPATVARPPRSSER
jgi:hypothetical protein